MIAYNDITGQPTVILSSLRHKVAAFYRHGAFHQKIGITNDPDRRWREKHSKDGWKKMNIIYRTSAHKNVCAIEDLLIKSFDASRAGGYYYNEKGGGGGRKPHNGPYYVYVLNAPKWSRIV